MKTMGTIAIESLEMGETSEREGNVFFQLLYFLQNIISRERCLKLEQEQLN